MTTLLCLLGAWLNHVLLKKIQAPCLLPRRQHFSMLSQEKSPVRIEDYCDTTADMVRYDEIQYFLYEI